MVLARKAWRQLSSNGLLSLFFNGFYFFRRRLQVPANAMVNHTRLRLSGEYSALAPPLKMVYVSPKKIQYKSYANFNKRYDMGRIISGDWDLDRRAFSDTTRYQAIEQRYREGCSWEETGIFEYHHKKIESSNGKSSSDGCFSMEDVQARYKSIDEMYDSMKSCGYNKQKAQHRYDHPYIHIGRDGELLHASVGNHRIAVAKLLGIESIPAFVVIRHADWQRRREEVASGNLVTREVKHPDLEELI